MRKGGKGLAKRENKRRREFPDITVQK